MGELSLSNEEREKLKKFWPYVRNVTLLLLVVWSIFAVFIHLLAMFDWWREIKIAGYPAHWLFGTQFSILAYIVTIFAYAYLISKKEEEVV
ncbi:DUF4212 domain-containing protein [Archaeoglobus veneficus]|uniref:Sodium symporter small subunit domain-containing protein n=1 Tax=Archaeoglobus veneficus (strain DSM 11195 / SNP6) TaxID=693661 RepID=F2KPD1_ARCVS|nr:DUF4212 domain-containing protein [Archaeoglobus veneficus]AEA46362.1 hypothetical protein Arcve_0329 [Archaeoglobus veneficus SNP6]